MTAKRYAAAVFLLAASGIAGTHLLTAQESTPIRSAGSRATPKQIRDAAERPTLTATAPHTVGRNVQDLRALADDLEKTGNRGEAARLKTAIKEIVRRAELEMAEKKAEIARLNEDIEDLKWAISQ